MLGSRALRPRIDPGRPYAEGERTALRRVFGELLDYDAVLIHRGLGPGLNPIERTAVLVAFAAGTAGIALRTHIYLRPDCWREDFSAGGAAGGLGLLAHESVHVWQYSKTGLAISHLDIGAQSLLMQVRKRRLSAPYEMGAIEPEADFRRLGFEQQANAVEAYATALLRGDASVMARYGPMLRRAGFPVGVSA